MSARTLDWLVVLSVFAIAVVVAQTDAMGSSTLAPADFQRVLMNAHMNGLSGRESVKDPVAISSTGDSGIFFLDLVVDVVETIPGAISFSRQADGSLALTTISAPEWMLRKAREEDNEYNPGELQEAVLGDALGVAGDFCAWFDGQTQTSVAAQPVDAVPQPSAEAKPAYLAVTLTLQGRLITVVLDGREILLEARQRDGEWRIEVIACKRTATS